MAPYYGSLKPWLLTTVGEDYVRWIQGQCQRVTFQLVPNLLIVGSHNHTYNNGHTASIIQDYFRDQNVPMLGLMPYFLESLCDLTLDLKTEHTGKHLLDTLTRVDTFHYFEIMKADQIVPAIERYEQLMRDGLKGVIVYTIPSQLEAISPSFLSLFKHEVFYDGV